MSSNIYQEEYVGLYVDKAGKVYDIEYAKVLNASP